MTELSQEDLDRIVKQLHKKLTESGSVTIAAKGEIGTCPNATHFTCSSAKYTCLGTAFVCDLKGASYAGISEPIEKSME